MESRCWTPSSSGFSPTHQRYWSYLDLLVENDWLLSQQGGTFLCQSATNHTSLRIAWDLESSWLEMRSRDRFLLIRKNKEPRERSQADRREVRIIHHQEGLYHCEVSSRSNAPRVISLSSSGGAGSSPIHLTLGSFLLVRPTGCATR